MVKVGVFCLNEEEKSDHEHGLSLIQQRTTESGDIKQSHGP